MFGFGKQKVEPEVQLTVFDIVVDIADNILAKQLRTTGKTNFGQVRKEVRDIMARYYPDTGYSTISNALSAWTKARNVDGYGVI